MINYVHGSCSSEAERAERLNTPVLYFCDTEEPLDELARKGELPFIWVTLPFWDDATNRACGRISFEDQFVANISGDFEVMRLPEGLVGFSIDDDGERALEYGAWYYNEGMERSDPAEHDMRIDCFRAAEICYLHAAAKGNVFAHENLGYVYSYDRCEGNYWFAAGGKVPFDREAAAYKHYLFAAEHDSPEACYKVGDLLAWGRGCEIDEQGAFTWYMRASKLCDAAPTPPNVWGSAAFRLGSCYEEGRGCEVDFSKVLKYYEQAVDGLGKAVDSGDWFYKKVLVKAQNGLKRVSQELDGTH